MKQQLLIGACCLFLSVSVTLLLFANRGSGRKTALVPETEQPNRGDGRRE